jgi:hypothetical protein
MKKLFLSFVMLISSSFANEVVGQWRSIITNPKYPNSIAKRYMRHSFFDDGRVVVEKSGTETKEGKWKQEGDLIIVKSSYSTSKFTETFKIEGDEIINTRFQSIVGGKPLADYNPKNRYVRQGSDKEKTYNVVDILEMSKSAMDFIDPNTLEIGKTYKVSKKTPLMPSYEVVKIEKMNYIAKGSKFKITGKQKARSNIWYQVENGRQKGWINSIALFGQKLK